MQAIRWFGRVSLVPAIGIALLVWWVAAALGRGGYDMSAWAVLLLFGGLALSRATPRVALVALFGTVVLQFARVVCRFDQEGWLAYAAIPIAAVVYGATTEAYRRRHLGALLGLGLLIGLFTNVPALGASHWLVTDGRQTSPLDDWGFIDGIGVVNGKPWIWPPEFPTGEVVVGTLVWSAGAMLLVLAGWTIGSRYRVRRLEWAADRAALTTSTADLRLAEQRDRIAQDVHDITAHRLSVILAQADGAATRAPDDATRAALATISGSARSALSEIRTLLEHLDGPPEGEPLGAADVRELAERSREDGVPVVLEEHGEPRPLTASAGLAAYRIVQEAIANAVRHGEPGDIRVTLDWRDDGLAVFVVSPLGPRSAVAGPPGRGLPGMRERARAAGGWLSAGGDGTAYVVSAHLPAAGADGTA